MTTHALNWRIATRAVMSMETWQRRHAEHRTSLSNRRNLGIAGAGEPLWFCRKCATVAPTTPNSGVSSQTGLSSNRCTSRRDNHRLQAAVTSLGPKPVACIGSFSRF